VVLNRLLHDTARSRDALQRSRALDALGFSSGVAQSREQRRLLPALASAAPSASGSPEVTDSAIAVALVYGADAPDVELQIIALSAEVLSGQREFARLRQLAPRLGTLGAAFRDARPYLSTVLLAFDELLRGAGAHAKSRLVGALGLTPDIDLRLRTVDATTPQLADMVLANAARSWLEASDSTALVEATEFALRRGVSSTYALARALLRYTMSATENATARVLLALAPEFGEPPLDRYLTSARYPILFPTQREAIEQGLFDDASLVLATPTSSGKTFLAELRVALEIQRSGGRVIYLAPYRLLSRQVERDMAEGLEPLGWSVRDFGGDFDATLAQQLEAGDLPKLGVMTPERLDGLVRLADSDRSGSEAAREFLEDVSLFVLDEAQLLGRFDRGPRLDLLLSRVRRRFPEARHLALSGVIAGADDFARWLSDRGAVTSSRRPTGTVELLWDSDGTLYMRTPQGPRRVIDIDRPKKPIEATIALLQRVPDDLAPALVVEPRKDYAEDVVRRLHEADPKAGDRWRETHPDEVARLDEIADQALAAFGEDNDLARLIRAGLAFHHAGLPAHLLRGIELLTRRRALRVVAATTTVAEGAHLPFQIVLIPHLNFESARGRLERDLYLNIVGRVGRANVAAEGFVIVFASAARTLVHHVEEQLWTDVGAPLRGRLTDQFGETIEGFRAEREVNSQILAWLGDRENRVEDQPRVLAQSTFSYATATAPDRERLVQRIARTMSNLETYGFAQAASPYRLTTLGERARLAGLAPRSCLRLDNALSDELRETLIGLVDVTRISSDAATAIAALLLETEEVLERTLWFRRATAGAEGVDPVFLLRELATARRDWPRSEQMFQVDLVLLAQWIGGSKFVELGTIPPTFRKPALFSATTPSARAAEAAEYFGNISYAASWTWAAALAMLGEAGEILPHWIRGAIEHGVPTEAAVELIERAEVSRDGAVIISNALADDWVTVEVLLAEAISDSELAGLGLTRYDRQRLRSLPRA